MANWKNQRKSILIQLATELGVEAADSDTNKALVKRILEAEDFDEDLTVSFAERLKAEFDREIEIEREREKLDRDRELEKQKLDRELEKEKLDREFELEKLRINCSLNNTSIRSEDTLAIPESRRKIFLKDIIPKLDVKNLDITLFFALFEKQANRHEIDEGEWVTQLIPLLPNDVIELIIREPNDLGEKYDHVKKLLLKRYRVSTTALKNKFEEHNRKFGSLWADLVYDLRSYLDHWLEALDVTEFEKLKELLILEQIKKRVDFETKMHFIDRWGEYTEAATLADKLDEYEDAKRSMKRETKPWEKRNPAGDKTFGARFKERKDPQKAAENKTETPKQAEPSNAGAKREFDKRKPMACFECNSKSHVRKNCEIWKQKNAENVNNVKVEDRLPICFESYLSKLKVNGVERTCLRDSGASMDVVSRNYISISDLTGESVDIKQPFDHEYRSYPVAKICLEGSFGRVMTKAIVKPSDIESGPYLIGNRTDELIQEAKKRPELVCALTRSKTKKKGDQTETQRTEIEGPPPQPEMAPHEVYNPLVELDRGEELLPPADCSEFSEMTGADSETFAQSQRECEDLKALWGKVTEGGEYRIIKNCLCRVGKDKRGDDRVQACVPLKYRDGLKKLLHEEISGHLGTTKTKDRLTRNFYWPNCYQDVEEFVRTCHPCQIVGNNRDKKKAPLKLVPIITEMFSKINIDATGPLPISDKGNKFLVTSICVSTKYPEAVATPDLTSDSVINALLEIFSRMGFPKEVQSDLGTSFTSHLTTAFFDRMGIKVSHSSVYHPSSNPVERMHGSLKRVLKALCLESGSDWEKNLHSALFALRTVTHESTGFSPSELVHGRNLRTPLTLLYEKWLDPENTDPHVVDYILEVTNRLKKWQEISESNQKDRQLKRKSWYDRKAVNRSFNVGDLVLVLATAKPNKMAVSWRGPGKITSKISDINYTVELPGKRDNLAIYHVNLLKPYYKRPELVNFIMDEEFEEIEHEAEIPYPVSDPNHFDLLDMIDASGVRDRLSPEQIDQLKEVLLKHRDVFSSEPGLTSLVEMDIVLESDVPVRSKPYRMSPRQSDILRKELDRMLKMGIIEIGQSDYSSPLILVEVPGKDPRPCVDYRKLNAITRLESFPIPNIEETVEQVCAAPFISVMDVAKGYFQIPLTERASRYAAFVTPWGSFIPRRSMFGLRNSGFYFCKLMALVLGELEKFSSPYIDDIAAHSLTWDRHLKDLDVVLGSVGKAGLKIKPSKCKFAQSQVPFLGHIVGSGMRSPNDAKIKALLDFPTPATKTQIRSFLGICGYYARYVKNYSVIAVPLTDALKGKNKKEKIVWTDSCEEAFGKLKTELTKKPVLYAPDFKLQFYVQSDASQNGAGIVLSQKFEEDEHPVVYLSKKFSRAERNYSTVERELAAIVYGVKKLHYYLDGRHFIVQSDHNPLCFLKSMAGTNARLTRWALYLQQYSFEVKHRPGKLHGNADALSRLE